MAYLEESLDLPLGRALESVQHRIVNETRYFGVRALKNPFDFWVYQEILFEVRPDLIIEIGNFHGGSLLALAHLCDALGSGRLIGIDVDHVEIPDIVRRHPRVTLIEGAARSVLDEVRRLIAPSDTVLVIEDSSHTYDNTLDVLRKYSQLVTRGSYFIVEDGICHHGLDVGPKPGPFEAIEAFIEENHDFDIDRARESFLITWNPKGFLRCVRAEAQSWSQLLGPLCTFITMAWQTVGELMAVAVGEEQGLRPGMVAMSQTFGDQLNPHPHVHALVTRGGWTASGEWVGVPYASSSAVEQLSRPPRRPLFGTDGPGF